MQQKIKIGVILLIILIIINLIIGGSMVFFVQNIKAPHIDVQFDLEHLTTDEMTFTSTLTMTNDNPFDLSLDNMEIIGKNHQGNTFITLQITGGTIAANQQKIFTTTDSVSFPGDISSTIYSILKGSLGVSVAGIIEKTIPFQINITASFQHMLQDISPPTIALVAQISEITETGVTLNGTVSIENPNSFELSLENLTTLITTENGTLVGELTALHGRITAKSISNFPMSGTLLFNALNAQVITLALKGKAAVHLMGFNKSIPLSITVQLPVPDIRELLFLNDYLGVSITLDVKIRLRGFMTTIGLQLYNPTKLSLQANDLICSIYGLTGENKKMIIQQPMESCTLSSNQQDCVETRVLIPYIKLLTSGTKKILPDWFVIRIQGNYTIAGVDQSIPIAIYADINPTLLR